MKDSPLEAEESAFVDSSGAVLFVVGGFGWFSSVSLLCSSWISDLIISILDGLAFLFLKTIKA
jgi:hypothetical protein